MPIQLLVPFGACAPGVFVRVTSFLRSAFDLTGDHTLKVSDFKDIRASAIGGVGPTGLYIAA